MSLTRLTLLLCVAAWCSACATTGSSRYSCGVPEGQPCRSALQVYAETDGAVTGHPIATANGSTPLPADDPWQLNQRDDGELVLVAAAPEPVPTVRTPMPVRTEARILRIWIAPFENADGDLVAGSHLYTEIEPRRWRVGQAALPATPSLSLMPDTSAQVTPIATGATSTDSD
ncbi:TraV family lipoprotein [Ahniella affigens]|nr:TraV family lipoprotein [Ahniella affigens]